MATISDTLRDEIFSKFTDVFPQFKTFSTYYKRLLIIWYFRLFVKCATISMILLLGICYYRNGVFNYSKDAGLYLVVLIICVFNSARQLRRDRRLEIYFLDASDAFEGMTEILLKWCRANNPSFAKMLKLLLEEMNGERSNELNTKDLLSLLIFDGIIWFANTTCLLVNMFNQFYFTVLIFFITTLLTIAMENLLVNMKNKPYKINENMTAEIDKICSIVNNYKEVTNDTDNSYGKTKPEMTDITKENSGFTVVSYLLYYYYFFILIKTISIFVMILYMLYRSFLPHLKFLQGIPMLIFQEGDIKNVSSRMKFFIQNGYFSDYFSIYWVGIIFVPNEKKILIKNQNAQNYTI